MKYKNHYSSPIGTLTLVSENNKLIAISFNDVEAITADNAILTKTKKWLDKYFAGENPDAYEIKFEMRGTEFQREIWSILLTIPYGQVTTYGQIAKIIANNRGIKRMSSQAVGNAVGLNPLAIIIPCHRVIGANNDLTGYAGGITKKIALLKIEASYNENYYYSRTKHNF